MQSDFGRRLRIDSIWLATKPIDMRAGTKTALAKVVAVSGLRGGFECGLLEPLQFITTLWRR